MIFRKPIKCLIYTINTKKTFKNIIKISSTENIYILGVL